MKGKKYTRFKIADMIDAIGEGSSYPDACMIFAYGLQLSRNIPPHSMKSAANVSVDTLDHGCC
jgi:hypothetical protein